MTTQAPTRPLSPGDTIGILGGGQLGRMLALAAAPLGLKTHILCPDPDSPAFEVASSFTIAGYDDISALDVFASAVDVVTYEFENVPGPTAAHLAERVCVRPGPTALAVSQDRLNEKTFLRDAGIPVADFARIDAAGDIAQALAQLGGTGILKTRRLGYDGKGQVLLRDGADAAAAFQQLRESHNPYNTGALHARATPSFSRPSSRSRCPGPRSSPPRCKPTFSTTLVIRRQ